MAILNNMPGGGGVRLSSIAITTPPTKTAYGALEQFDSTGMVVTATYTNGATLEVGGYTVSPSPLTMGTTAVTITYTEGGVSRTATQAVTVSKNQVTVPTVSGSLTYDGTEQSPTILDEPSADIAARSGDASAINAGSYTKTYTLTDSTNYEWATSFDGNLSWSIGKAPAGLSLSADSATLNASNPTETISISTDSDGALSASSSDTGVATGSISGSTLTISSVNSASGTATITVSQAESTNYQAGTATVSVTAQFISVYGVSWDGTSTTAWTRTDDAALFSDPVPYLSGAQDYGSPFDGLSPWKDMVRVTDAAAGEMVKIPKFWYKISQSGSGLNIQIADGEKEGFSVCPACMDRGDGNGEHDYVLVGRYHCATSTYKSTTGVKPAASATRSTFRSSIKNLGTGIYMMDWATRFTIWLLYLVEFADWNSQLKIGYGCGNNSATENMGYTDSMPYHTGTTKSSRTTYGLGTQYRYIEGLWDNVRDWIDGCYNNSSGLNIILDPTKASDSSNGISVGTPTSGYPTAFTLKNVNGTFPLFIASAANNGSDSTYSCDSWYFDASVPCVDAGGGYSQSLYCGLFFFNYSAASSSYASLGSRSMKFP